MHRSAPERFRSLARFGQVRLMLFALAAIVPVATGFAAFVGWQVNQLLAERTFEELRDDLQILRVDLDRGGIVELRAAVAARSGGAGPGLYLLANANGERVAGNLVAVPEHLSAGPSIFSVPDATNTSMRTAAGLQVTVPGGGQLVVARDIGDQRAFATRLQLTAFAAVSLISGIAMAFAWLESRRNARRLVRVSEATQSIVDGDLSRRLPVSQAGDEFDILVSIVNHMLTRIEELMGALREVSDNIAHDLKTPLTRLRNRAEAAIREGTEAAHQIGLEHVIEEADGLIQTFNALLLIARVEASAVDTTMAQSDLREIVSDAAELYQPVADDAGLALVLDAPKPVMLAVNKQLIGQAVANLIDNAIKYSADTAAAASGPIVVGLTEPDADTVEISVADRGPGIPASDRERVMKRFVRLEQSRSRPGTGLGLSLAAAVARLHGGRVRLEDNAPGLRIVLVLPRPKLRAAASQQSGALMHGVDRPEITG